LVPQKLIFEADLKPRVLRISPEQKIGWLIRPDIQQVGLIK
jgi:hypothetical protein